MKNDKVQILRAAAIMAVIIIHTCPSSMEVWVRPFVNFAVAMFLFLSGYLTVFDRYSSNKQWLRFYWKRTIRVLVPYMIWTFLYTVLSPRNIGTRFLYNIATAGGGANLYYIFVYVQLALFTPLFKIASRSRYRFLIFAIGPLSLLFFKYLPLLHGHEFGKLTGIWWSTSCLAWIPYYYFGLLCGNGIVRAQCKTSWLTFFYLAALSLEMFEGYFLQYHGIPNCGSQLKLSTYLTNTAVLFASCRFLACSYDVSGHKALLLTGSFSFGIYFVHVLLIKILRHIPIYGMIPFPLNSFVLLSASLAAIIISDKILGKRLSAWIGLR